MKENKDLGNFGFFHGIKNISIDIIDFFIKKKEHTTPHTSGGRHLLELLGGFMAELFSPIVQHFPA